MTSRPLGGIRGKNESVVAGSGEKRVYFKYVKNVHSPSHEPSSQYVAAIDRRRTDAEVKKEKTRRRKK
ncbi:MAG: hypothetical protein V1676_04610 [Candidatus Diapherotrites archaeon]